MEKLLAAIDSQLRKAKGKEKKRLQAYRGALQLQIARIRHAVKPKDGRILSRHNEKVVRRAQTADRRMTLGQCWVYLVLHAKGKVLVGVVAWYRALQALHATKDTAMFAENAQFNRELDAKPSRYALEAHSRAPQRSAAWKKLRLTHPHIVVCRTQPEKKNSPIMRVAVVQPHNTEIPANITVTRCPPASALPPAPSSRLGWLEKARKLSRMKV